MLQGCKEITLEITDYCPHSCTYCSTDAAYYNKAKFISYKEVERALEGPIIWDLIHISGGEPLAHPDFYSILKLCKTRAIRVIVHTNEITDIAFNPNVIDGIRVEAYLTVPDTTDTIHILKRVRQGREARRPGVTFSSNYYDDCSCLECNHTVIRPDGTKAPAPCKKDK
jgi:organic radical activating enzyme